MYLLSFYFCDMNQTNKIKYKSYNNKVVSKFKWPKNKNMINGMYISTDGKTNETKKGTEKYFETLLNGKISEYTINENYKILYNYQSKDGKNNFLENLVKSNDIRGPIIFISNNNISIKEIKKILNESDNQNIWILDDTV